MKRILITGANSYIGDSVRDYLLDHSDHFSVDVMDTVGYEPDRNDFTGYDVVLNAAGIAHRKESRSDRELYYRINRDLTLRIAESAKAGGAGQFILLSSMSVYGMSSGHITRNTKENPLSAYGESKLQADEAVRRLAEESFKVVCLRPPMVYGKGCRGNYQKLRSFALKAPFIPAYNNQRSMIYIGNLCEFIKTCIDDERNGLFLPQNSEYVTTGEMIRQIAIQHGRKVTMTRALNPFITIAQRGHVETVEKAFGSLTYEKTEPVGTFGFERSIELTETLSQADEG